MNFSHFRKIYLDSIPLIVKFTSSAGLFTGVYANILINNNKKENSPYINEITTYSNLIGYTTVGMVTGVTYPISFPLLAYYAFYKNVSHEEPK
jgi:hypothetical protein